MTPLTADEKAAGSHSDSRVAADIAALPLQSLCKDVELTAIDAAHDAEPAGGGAATAGSSRASAASAAPASLDEASDTADSVFVFPASPAQRRFWLLDGLQGGGGNPALNMPQAFWLQGPLDRPALERALNELVRRHESLRTTFGSERGVVQQIVAPSLELRLSVVDARSFPPSERDRVAPHLIEEEAHLPFDLARGPLVRARLVRVADDQHFLLLTLHHIITDGWSNGILLRELIAIYNAFAAGEATSPLPEPALQFADFSEWQTAALADGESETFADAFRYWRGQLAGALPVLDLPTDRPRPAASARSRVAEGAARTRLLPRPLVEAVRALATREGISPFMIHLAAFEALLHRYTGQTDIVLSSPLANRSRPELEDVVGLFVNPLILRTDLSGNPTAGELIARVRRCALDAFTHGDLPFERLVEELQPERLQVSFLYQPAFVQPAELHGGLKISPLPLVTGGALFELSAVVMEEADGTRFYLEYNTELFDAETAERMLGHYQTLLEGLTANAGTPLSKLPLLTLPERLQFAAAEGLDTPAPGSAEFVEELPDLRALLITRVAAAPDAVVAREGRRELSCAELLAHLEHLRERGEKAPSVGADFARAAAFVSDWRTSPAAPAPSPPVRAAPAAIFALRDSLGLRLGERLAACSARGSAAAAEEFFAALLSGALIVYPRPDTLAGPSTALASWLDKEGIAAACLPATTWNRLTATFEGRRVASPRALRTAVVCEGDPREGTFGRVRIDTAADEARAATPRILPRVVLEAAGGTVALGGRPVSANARRLRVLDPHSGQLMPVGVPGELCVVPAGNAAEPVRAGELARWRRDGSLERFGRMAEQRHARGFRLDIARAEAVICAMPGVRHALVRSASAVPNATEDDRAAAPPLVAYLVPNTPTEAFSTDAALRSALRERGLPDELLPVAFLRLDRVPIRELDGCLDDSGLPAPPENLPARLADSAHEAIRPYLALHYQILSIWEELLGIRGIGIRDDFFSLGGNSLLAIRMLHRIEAVCGKVILPATLFTAATVEHLADEIALQAAEEAPPVLAVNENGSRTPFFYLHGDLSGGGFYSLKLSRALGPEQPFYALPPQDVRTPGGGVAAAPSLEEMAAAHLRAIRAVRPRGPYVIGGFCIGGLVAYEVARQIEVSGDTVEMLLVIDAAADDRTLRRLRRLALRTGSILRWDEPTTIARFGRWVLLQARLARWARLDWKAQTRVVFHRAHTRLLRARWAVQRLLKRPATGSKMGEADSAAGLGDLDHGATEPTDTPTAFRWATAGHPARPYRGAMALLLSSDLLEGSLHLARDWKKVAPAVSVHPLAGSHLECITEHIDTLAETIQDCLDLAAASGPRPRRQSRQKSSGAASVTTNGVASVIAAATATADNILW